MNYPRIRILSFHATEPVSITNIYELGEVISQLKYLDTIDITLRQNLNNDCLNALLEGIIVNKSLRELGLHIYTVEGQAARVYELLQAHPTLAPLST